MTHKFNIKITVYFTLFLVLFGKYTSCFSSISVMPSSPEFFFEKIVTEGEERTCSVTVYPDFSEPYLLFVNSSHVLPLIRADYSLEQIENIFDITNEARKLQCFFDSWFALSSLQIYKETGELFFYKNAVKYMNRSLSQLTDSNMYTANANKLKSIQLPESYNFIYNGNIIIAIPAPITPLNWDKTSLTILLKEMESVSRKYNGEK